MIASVKSADFPLSLIARLTPPGPLRGGAADPLSERRFFTWGHAVYRWEAGKPRRIATAPHGFDNGGCVWDADADGFTDLILVRLPATGALGELVLLRGPRFEPQVIDTDVELHDCLPAELFGRRGFLMIHRHAQVRFYQVPKEIRQGWPVREIYSIYTASRQGGLALEDVNGDGRVDIYCGNYWIRSPESFELPWRLFAIHLHHQSESDASFVYGAPSGGNLIGAQREWPDAPLRAFRKPTDPEQLWPERILGASKFTRPSALVQTREGVLIGHAQGLSYVRLADGSTAHNPYPAIRALWAAKDRIYAVASDSVSVWGWRR
jgi:hypothetical protein